MYDELSDTAAAARTSNLNEELGQACFFFKPFMSFLTVTGSDYEIFQPISKDLCLWSLSGFYNLFLVFFV